METEANEFFRTCDRIRRACNGIVMWKLHTSPVELFPQLYLGNCAVFSISAVSAVAPSTFFCGQRLSIQGYSTRLESPRLNDTR